MNRTRTLALTLLAAAAGATLFAWGRWSAREHAEGDSAHAERTRELRSDETTAAALAGDDAARAHTDADAPRAALASEDAEFAGLSNPRVGTLRELCEEYYGMPWDALRELLVDPDVDPDAIVQLYPWEQVAPHMRREFVHTDDEGRREQTRQILGWGGTQTRPSWYGGLLNPQKKQLASVDVQNLERMNTEYDSRLTDLAEAVNELVPRCLADRFDRGQFTRAPLVTTKDSRGDPPKPSEFRRALTTQGAGWTATLVLESADYPELERLGQEIQAVKRERYERLRAYIASR